MTPVVFEQIHQRLVKKANGPLQHPEKMSAAESPAVLQKNVVLLLDANAGQFSQNVEAIGEILELDELDLPIASLLEKDSLQGNGRVLMSSSRVVVDDSDFLHWGNCVIAGRDYGRAHSLPCG